MRSPIGCAHAASRRRRSSPTVPLPAIDRRTAERLRRGQIAIEATIDLHGFTQDEAFVAIETFLAESVQAGRRCVLVITGKGTARDGGGVLRSAVPRWLTEGAHREHLIGIEGRLSAARRRRRALRVDPAPAGRFRRGVTPASRRERQRARRPRNRSQRELRDFLRFQEQRRRQLPRALLVGVIAGLRGGRVRARPRCRRSPANAAARARPCARAVGRRACRSLAVRAAAGVAVHLVARFAPEAGGSGIPHLKAVLQRLRAMRWQAILPVKFVGGVIGIGAGLALGREGPTVQMGGAIGEMVGGWFRCTRRERNTLIAAGAGAGLSAAFNAPLAGLVFVLEEVQRDFSPVVFTVTLVASVVADVTSRLLLGRATGVRCHGARRRLCCAGLPLYLAVGVAGGTARYPLQPRVAREPGRRGAPRADPARGPRERLVGAAIGLVGWFLPMTIGGGGALVNAALAGGIGVGRAALADSPAARHDRGQLRDRCRRRNLHPDAGDRRHARRGAWTAVGERRCRAGLIDQPTFIVVGMAAFFTAVVRAPLTAIVLLVEMTGDYGMVLPLLIACLAAGGSRRLPARRGRSTKPCCCATWPSRRRPEAGEALVLEFNVADGSTFDGARSGARPAAG